MYVVVLLYILRLMSLYCDPDPVPGDAMSPPGIGSASCTQGLAGTSWRGVSQGRRPGQAVEVWHFGSLEAFIL